MNAPRDIVPCDILLKGFELPNRIYFPSGCVVKGEDLLPFNIFFFFPAGGIYFDISPEVGVALRKKNRENHVCTACSGAGIHCSWAIITYHITAL